MKPAFRRTAALVCAAALLPVAGCSLPHGAQADPGPTFPKAWDPKVLPYVHLASKLRDLDFEHPVEVDFQTPKEFEKGLKSDKGDLTKEDLADLQHWTGMLRALGLVHGDVDLFDEQEKLTAGGTLAYYSFDDQLIRVRGTRITPAVKSTLVHELVHVLQDQNFDAGAHSRKLEKADDSSGLAYDALVEGDASRIQTKYAAQLSPKARRALRRDQARQSHGASDSVEGVPEVLRTMMGAPYSLGEALLDVATLDGDDEVDKLFRKPPTTEENLVDPFTLTWDGQKAVHVAKPKLPSGAKEFDSNTFESTGWLFTLAARLPVRRALTATDGWGGDRYVAYTNAKGTTCVDISYVGDTARDADELASTLTAWIRRGPKGVASVTRQGDKGLLFSSCDPGTAAKGSGEHSDEALNIALYRTYLTRSLIEDHWTHDRARCFGTALVENFTRAQIEEHSVAPEVVAKVRRLAQGCAG
ncbi:hypothetical protein [Nocardioides jiangxiensis]|uniref:Lipoprotein n=1 Tax=Nocardioides jiangxiensis TaxID=3064524 RepID=A0ABT9B2A4_9ACTN|nr:hypothetical protein [Nocardioides sp. WY-20]MDO7867752.1 hypothetical protein [Nocardioides sp. WY-20]